MEGDHIKICYWLKPLSWLYGLVINLRNILYNSRNTYLPEFIRCFPL